MSLSTFESTSKDNYLVNGSNGPIDGSYSPPGTAFLRLSKIIGVTIRLTLNLRTCGHSQNAINGCLRLPSDV